MRVIGLTGRACAGKDQYAAAFASLGCKVVDVDKLGHAALQESEKELIRAFGPQILTDGQVDRKKLGAIVFADPAKLRLLEAITHPKMVEECRSLIEQGKREKLPALVLNAALLQRMGLAMLCDQIVFVQAPWLVRFFRSRKRENYTLKLFLHRERSQFDITVRALGTRVPIIVMRNWRSRSIIRRQVAFYCATIGLSISSTR